MYSEKAKRSAVYEPRARVGCAFVVGAAGSGKTEFAAALAAATGLRVGETSSVIIDNLAAVQSSLFEKYQAQGCSGLSYNEWKNTLEDKAFFRKPLVIMGNLMTAIRGDALIDPLVRNGARIITGVRRHGEVETRLSRGCKDIWIKIERPGYTAPADSYELDGCERYITTPVLVIENTSLDALQAAAIAHAPRILEVING